MNSQNPRKTYFSYPPNHPHPAEKTNHPINHCVLVPDLFTLITVEKIMIMSYALRREFLETKNMKGKRKKTVLFNHYIQIRKYNHFLIFLAYGVHHIFDDDQTSCFEDRSFSPSDADQTPQSAWPA